MNKIILFAWLMLVSCFSAGNEIPPVYFGHWINAEQNPEGLIIEKNRISTPYFEGVCIKKVVSAEPADIKYYDYFYTQSEIIKKGYTIKLRFSPSKLCGALSEEVIEVFLEKSNPEFESPDLYVKYVSVGATNRLYRGGSGKFDPKIYCDGSSGYSMAMCANMEFIKIESELRNELSIVISKLAAPDEKEELINEQKNG